MGLTRLADVPYGSIFTFPGRPGVFRKYYGTRYVCVVADGVRTPVGVRARGYGYDEVEIHGSVEEAQRA